MGWKDQWSRSALLNEDDWTVDWTQAGLVAVGTVLSGYFDAVAGFVGTLIGSLLIRPANSLAAYLSWLIESTVWKSDMLISQSFSGFAGDLGFIGSLVVILAGGYLFAVVLNEVVLDG